MALLVSKADGQPVHFALKLCLTIGKTEPESNPLLLADSKVKQRKYHRAKKPTEPRTWRTRQDPFAAVGAELHKCFRHEPGVTAKTRLQQLQQQYPGQNVLVFS